MRYLLHRTPLKSPWVYPLEQRSEMRLGCGSVKFSQQNDPNQFFQMKSNYLFLGALVIAAACGSPEGASETAVLPVESDENLSHVETLTLQPSLFEDVIIITGTIAALNDASLSAQASGTIQTLAALGQTVDTDTPLAQLDDALVRAVVDQAQAQSENAHARLELATDNYNRLEPLFADSIISALEFTPGPHHT